MRDKFFDFKPDNKCLNCGNPIMLDQEEQEYIHKPGRYPGDTGIYCTSHENSIARPEKIPIKKSKKNKRYLQRRGKFMVVIFLLALYSCDKTDRRFYDRTDKDFKVELLNCTGEVIKSYRTRGKVRSSGSSGRIYFIDRETNLLIELHGTSAVFTEIK